MQVEKE